MTPPTLNQVATWLPMKRDELDVKVFDSYQFLDDGVLKSASAKEPVFRMAKNYSRGRVKFSLCIITLERDTKKIEKFLDEASETVEYNPRGRAFVRTDVFYKA